MPERLLLTGASGMLGTALERVCAVRGVICTALPRTRLDITDPHAVRSMLSAFASDGGGLVVNAAAYTDVEGAEDDEETAFSVNERGAGLLAETCRDPGLRFVHVSTDFVFDGRKDTAYTEDDEPCPLSVYGASKLAGERAVLAACPEALIVRTAWVFGPGGRNFPGKMIELARTHGTLSVVTDETGSPTYTMDLAAGILALAATHAAGVYHLAGAGGCSRFEMAAETLRLAGLERELVPTTSDAFPTKARRPTNSVLDCGKAASLGVTMPEWRDGLRRYVEDVFL